MKAKFTLFFFFLSLLAFTYTFGQSIVEVSSTNPLCRNDSNGTITIIVEGGIPGYTYSLQRVLPTQPALIRLGSSLEPSFTFSNLPFGTYVVAFEDSEGNGEAYIDFVTLRNPSAVDTRLTGKIDVVCNGDATGSISVNGTGGTDSPTSIVASKYEFQLTGPSFPNGSTYMGNGTKSYTFTNLQAGNYTVVARDFNNCVDQTPLEVNIAQPVELSSSFTTSASTLCTNQNLVLTYTGTSGLNTYNWNFDGGVAAPGSGAGPHNIVFATVGTKTITLQVIDNTGCVSSTTSRTITVNETPVLTITNPTAVCFPATVDLTAAGITAGSTGGGTLTYWSDAAGTTALPSPNAVATSGTYYIKSTTTAGCSDIKPVTVTINPTPVLTITNPATVCTPATVNLTAAAVTAGSTGNGTLSYWTDAAATTALATPSAVSVGGTYYIMSTSGAGCTDIKPVIVTINLSPSLVITNPAAVCTPTTVNLTLAAVTAGSTGNGALTYWTDAAATLALSNPNAVATSGTYYIKSTVATGCFDIKPVTVTVNPTPVLVITNPAPVCTPATVNLTAAAVTAGSTGNGTLSYWTDAAATQALSNPSAVSTSGTYYIRSISAAGCTDIKPVNITVNPSPSLVITNPAVVCSPTTVNLTLAAVTAGSTGNGTLTYWTDAAATLALSNPNAVAASGTYYIKSTVATGCFDVKPVTVTVNPTPVLVITNPAAVCSPATVNLTAAAVTAGSTGAGTLSYWTDAGATNALASPSAVATSGTYFIRSATAAGCFDIKPVTVTVNPSPVLVITNPAAVCSPATVDLTSAAVTAGSTGGGTLTYWTNAAATTAVSNPNAVATSGTYYIRSVTAAGCSDIKPVTVTVNPTPVLVISNPAAVCSPATVDLTAAAVTAGSTGVGTFTYWTNAAGTIALSSPNAVSASGTYYIRSTNGAGCTDIKPVTVTVNPAPVLVITNPAAVCSPATVNLTAASVTAGSTGGTTFTYWTNAAGTTALSGPAAVSVSGTYYIRSTNAAGCSDIKPVTVTINSSPVLVITNPAAVCSPATVNLTAAAVTAGSTGNGTLTYWTDAAATLALSNPSAVSTSGTYYIRSTTGAGCTDIKPVTVTVNPTPVLVINNPAAVCSPATVNLTAAAVTAGSTGSGTLTYWTDAAATSALSNPSAVSTSGTYYIKSTNAAGCADTKPVTVTINPTPVLTITNPSAVCAPASVDLTAASITAGSTGGGTLSYWTDAAASNALASPTAVTVSGTYYIRSTTANGCSDIKAVTVTVNPAVAVPTVAAIAYCQNDVANALTATGTNLLWYSAATGGTGSASAPVPVTTASGTFSFFVSQTVNGCESPRATLTVTVHPTPVLTITDPAAVCSPDTVDLTAAAVTAGSASGTFSYWTNAAATTALANPASVATSGTYYIKITDSNGCSTVRPVTVTINAAPVATINYMGSPYCISDPNPSPTLGAGAVAGTFTATPAGLSINASTGVIDLFASVAGNYTVTNTVTLNGCTSVSSTPVRVKESPKGDFSYAGSPYCQGSATTVSPTFSSAGVAGTFTATPSGLTINATTGVITLSTSAAGTYTVTNTVTANGNGGCTAIATATVVIEPSLISSVSISASATSVCAGTAIAFTATPTNGGSTPTYQWRVNGVDVSGANAATFTSSTLANSDQVSVVMTAGGTGTGCITGSPATSNNVGITISNSLTSSVSIVADQTTVCASTAITFTATPTNGGSAPTYQWRVNGVNVNGATNATFTSSTLNNNDQVSVVMTAGGSGTSCISGSPATSNAVTITLSNSLTALVSIVADQTNVCAGTAVTFTATPTNGGSTPTYQWRINGVNVSGATNAAFTSSTLSNNDQVSVVMTAGGSGTGCITGSPATSNAVVITLSNSLTASVSISASATTVCAGTAVTFTATPTNGGSAPTYQWRVNGVNIANANSSTFASSTLANNDQVSVIMTAGGTGTGCITGSPATSNAVGITLSNNLTAGVSISASATTVCAGTAITLTATPTNGGSAPTYQWRVNGVNVNGATNATFTSSTLANNDQVSVVMTAGGTGTSCVTGSPATSNVVAITLSNSLTASVSITADQTTVCAGTAITFTATPTNGGSVPTYQWRVNGVDVSGANAATFTSSTLANSNQVSVVMTAGGTGTGCISGSPATSNSVAITLSNSLTASVNIVADQTNVCAGTAITFTATPANSGSAPTYQWRINGIAVNGATNATFTSSTLTNSDQVSVVMTAGGAGIGCISGSPATSNNVGIIISNSLTASVSISASATTVCAGTDITFTATPTNGGSAPTYQWRVNGVDVSGANAATFTSSNLTNNDQVSVLMTAEGTGTSCISGSPATSNNVGITISNSLTASVSITADQTTVCAGTTVTFTATPANSGSAPTYQWRINGIAVNGATNATFTSSTLTNSDQVSVVMTAGGAGIGCISGSPATSNNVGIIISNSLTASVSISASATTVCAGTDITFTATPTNGGSAPTYQWRINGVDVNGATNAAFASSTLNNNDQVSVVMTAGGTGTGCITGSPATSNNVAITISNSLTASVSITADQTTVCAGTAITFTATPTNGGSTPTYQWRVNGVNVNGATNATFTSSTLSNNDQVSVIMTAGGTGTGCISGSPATSNAVSITLSNSLTSSVSIAADQTTVCAGTGITFTATPINGGSAPTYQWRINGVNVGGATSATFTSSILANNDQVSVVMTAGGTGTGCISGSPATSNAVAITISNSLTASVSITADQTTVCPGTAITFTATATNGGSAPTYQWRVNGVNVANSNGSTFTSSTLSNNDQVSVIMTAGGTGTSCVTGSPATSNAVGITISNNLTASVSISASATTVCAGTAVTFTAAPTNGGSAPTYQWRINGVILNGATNATFTSSTLNNNDQVSVVMTAGGTGTGCITSSPATSNAVAITISNSLTASVSITADQTTVCTGTAITFTATPTNGGSTPTYQWRVNGVNVNGATNAAFTSSTLSNNDQVSVVMTAGGTGTGCISGSPATSNNVGITISNSLTASVSISASATTVCTGTAITFTATPTNGGSTPTYQWRVNGVNIANATGTTFTSSNLASNDQVSVVMTAGGSGAGCITGSPATSNSIGITISNSLTASVSVTASATAVCAGTDITFTATPLNGGSTPTYQWRINGVNVNGATNAIFTSNTLANNDQVSVVMTAGGTGTGCISGSPATSNSVGITISNSLTASVSIVSDQTNVCAGTAITFTATSTNGGSAPTYQWRINGIAVNGATNVTFTSSNLANNDQVSVVMTAGGTGTGCISGSPATSNAVAITLSNSLTASVSITADQTTVCAGTPITFTATATNGGSAPTYQWRVNGVNVNGSTNATFTSSTLNNNDQVSVIMTAGGTGTGCISGSPATSNAVSITLSNNLTAGVSISASATTVCAGTAITFTATPANGGSTPAYQWRVNGVDVTGADVATFTSSTLANNDQVSVVMTAGGTGIGCISGSPATSNQINITLSNSLTASVSVSASATTVCAGTAITFTASATNGGSTPTYQWRINGVNVANATNATFTSSTLINNDQVSVIMTAGGSGTGCITGSPATSNAVGITISNSLTSNVSISASATTVCPGTSITFTATPTNGGSAPTYQWRMNGVNVNGATSGTFTSSTLANNDQVSVVMTAGGSGTGCILGSPATSNNVGITISNNLTASVSIVADQTTVCAGTAITFTATPTNSGSAPTYQWLINGLSAGATGATFTSSTLTNNDKVSVVMTAGGTGTGCISGSPATSNQINITLSNSLTASVSITADQTTVCPGTAITFTATSTNGGSAPAYQWRVNGVNVNGATNATFTSSTLANNDQVSVVMTAGGTGTGCIIGSPATSNAVAITISNSLAAGVSITASANGPFCAGSSINFTATPSNGGVAPTYQWRVNGVNVNGANLATFTSSTLNNNDQVSVVMTPDVSGSNSCVNPGAATSNQIAVIIKPVSDPSCNCNLLAKASSNPVTCQGDTNGEAIALVLSGGSGQYLYSLNGGTPVSLDQIFAVFRNQPFGPFSIQITDRNNTNCTTTIRENIGALVTLVAQVNGTDPTCIGNDGKIEFAPFQTGNGGGTAPYQISIDGGATFTQTATGALTFSNLRAGTYNVVISDGTPCTTSFAVRLNAASAQIIPTVAISTPSPTVCTGQPVTFTASITNGGNVPRYQWQVNGINVNGATNATFTSSTLTSADRVTLVMTPDQSGAGSCINPAPVTSNSLSVTPSNRLTPGVTITTPNASVCAGAAVTFTATPANGGTNPAYQWRVNGVNVAGANTSTFTTSTLTGTDVVTVVMTPDVTGTGSCIQLGAVTSNGLSISISNSIAPSVSIATPASQVCVGTAVTFTATAGNGGNSPAFQWRVNGINVVNATTRTFTSSTLTSSDVVTVVMTPDQSGGNTCINPAPVTSNNLSVTVSSSLTASVNVSASSTNICVGGTVTFTATATNGGANPAYQWKINGVNVAGATAATFSGSNLNNNDQVTVVMTPDVSGSNSCVNPGAVNGNNIAITVRPANDPSCGCNLNVAAQITNVKCQGGSNGEALVFVVTGGSGSYEYRVGNGAYQDTPNFTGLTAGTYQFTVRDKSTNCLGTTTVNLSTQFTVAGLITRRPPANCNDKGSIQFTTITGTGSAPYQVSIDGINFVPYATSPTPTTFNGLEPGDYQTTIKDANDCVFTVITTIEGVSPIIANLSKTDVSCTGGSNGVITISNPSGGAGNGYVYSMDGTSYSGTTSFTGLRAGSYTFYVKDAQGTCLQPFQVVVSEPAAIQATVNATQPASCQAADGQISAVVNSGGLAPFEYRLNNGTFQTASSFTALGNGSYTLTIRDANGCEATRQVSLTSAGAITATATVISGASCSRADGSAQLTNVTGGSGNYEYSKDGISYQDSPLFQNLRSGNYLLIVRDKATNGCTATYPVSITETLQVVATVTVTRVPGDCQARDGEITVSNASGGQPAYQYSLDSLINFQTSPVFSGLSNGNYKVYVRDSRGCYGIYSTTLASPNAIRVGNAIAIVSPSCVGRQDGRINMNASGSNVSGGQPGYLYSLNGGDFQTASLFSGLAAGAYQVKVKDQANCELTFNYTLTDPAGLSFDVVQTTSAGCGGEAGAVEVQNVSGGQMPYAYSINGIDFQSSITFANLTAGAYTMYVRDASLQTTCISSKAFNVLGSTAVQFTVSTTNIGCEGGDRGQITINNIVGGIPATGPARYKVSINGGQSFRDVTGESLVFDNLRPGNYEVILTYGENLGCSTSTRQVTITSAGIFFEVKTTAATCGEANGKAEAVVPDASPSYSYSLEPNTGFRPSPVFTDLRPGVYTMYIRTGAVETCPNQQTFTVPGPAKLEYKFKKNNSCEGDECQDTSGGSIVFTDIKGGVLPYKVSVDNGANFTFDIYQNNYTVSGLKPGDYQIIVADATGCRTISVPVRIEESRMRARVRVEPSLLEEPTGSVWVQDIRGGTPVYEVSIDGLTWAPVTSPKLDTVITGIAVGSYKLFIRDANGCMKCFKFNIEESKFTIPNIFTPNGDTYNDTFRIRNLPDGSLLSIVNRWGKVVYQTSSYQNDWDGGTLPDAIYFYTLNVPGKGAFTGWVEIRRSE